MTSADAPAAATSSGRLRRRAVPVGLAGRRPRPAALVALLVLVAAAGACWALLVPPFQAPDETTHFAYAQSLATRFALPGGPHRPLGISTDQGVADGAVGASRLAFSVGSTTPDWSRVDFDGYLALVRRTHPSQSNGGGPNPQAVNPPLFYLFSDIGYWVSGSSNLFARLYAMRIWGVVLLLVNTIAGWLLGGAVLGRRRLAQFACAAVCGLMPMESFIATSITPDALMVPLWTLALWLGARLIRSGWRTADAVGLAAATAAAILTKATSYALAPAAVVALLLAWVERPIRLRRERIVGGAAALVTLVVPVLGWVAYTRAAGRLTVNSVGPAAGTRPAAAFTVKGFLSYLWQFYLPRLPFMAPKGTTPDVAVYDVWVKEGWATFGWLDVQLPSWLYPILDIVSGAIGAAALWLILAARRARRWGLLIFFGLALAALLVGLHVTAYRSILAGQGTLLQGRYLLPGIGLFGLAIAVVIARLPVRLRTAGTGLVLVGLVGIQIVSLAAVLKSYYT